MFPLVSVSLRQWKCGVCLRPQDSSSAPTALLTAGGGVWKPCLFLTPQADRGNCV